MVRCLFVDDSGLIRKVAKRILGGVGITVVEADSGSEALMACAAEMPDIIVVDAILPGTDAPDLIRQIRAMPEGRSPHILLCLVEMDIAAIMRARRAGAEGYLLKPFDRTQILQALAGIRTAA